MQGSFISAAFAESLIDSLFDRDVIFVLFSMGGSVKVHQGISAAAIIGVSVLGPDVAWLGGSSYLYGTLLWILEGF